MKLHLNILLLISLVFTSSLYAVEQTSTIASEIFKGCAKCHGKDGKNAAFGRSEPLVGQEVEDLVESINFFKDSEFGKKGVILVMSKQVNHLNEKQINELAEYISKLGR
ncbi:c-type cytochrome [Sulfurospirillum sp.]|nr:c-type cytochrome [Sulfurospirillum sp.]